MSRKFDILVVKDFSRFSRRNSRGLVELEDLRDAGVRIISIGDGIDFPNDDDWLKIQFQFLINEMPVTDTSKKVRNVIKRRQMDGAWLCAAPYGYIINKKKEFEIVPTEADIVRRIFDHYNNDGWGYKKIANHLTDEGIPTPRMSEQLRREADGLETKRKAKPVWAIVTVQGILDNDFYIGTLRQGKYTRAKINGRDIKRDDGEVIVIENHHQSIIDYRTFATTRALREKRTRANYRGVKVNDNVYSGFLECGDCGSPMFAMSRRDLKPAYTCGTYHRRGTKGCSAHHIHVEKLDELLKIYLRRVRDGSDAMLAQLNAELAAETENVAETEQSADHLAEVVEELREELRITKRQRVRDILKKPQHEDLLNETYDELEADLERKIAGFTHQIDLLSDKRNTILRVNRVAKTAVDIFSDILEKEKLDRNDLELLIDRIKVYEDRLEIQLQADIDSLLRVGEGVVNFNAGIEDSLSCRIVQRATHQKDKVFDVHVISNGDPLEIYTEKDGEVIFKKYSPMGDLADYAGMICDSIGKNTGHMAAVADRDSIIALAGAPRRELMDKRISQDLEELMQQRKSYRSAGAGRLPVTEGQERYFVGAAAPILSEGDLMGSVMILADDSTGEIGESDLKLAQTVAGFLGRQMES